jgi:hypothetical protein
LAGDATNFGAADTVAMSADLPGSSRQAVTRSIHGRGMLIGATNHSGTSKSAKAFRDLANPLSNLLTLAMKKSAASSTLVVRRMRYTLAPEIAKIYTRGNRAESRLSRTSLKGHERSGAWFDWVARLYIQAKNCQEKNLEQKIMVVIVALMTLASRADFPRSSGPLPLAQVLKLGVEIAERTG